MSTDYNKTVKHYEIVPTTRRQKKYMSAVWTYAEDGGAVAVTPNITSVLPKGAVIIDHVIENIALVTVATGTPNLKIKLGSTEITTSAVGWSDFSGVSDVEIPATTNVKLTDAAVINLLFSGTVTGGGLAVTVGYFDPGNYINL